MSMSGASIRSRMASANSHRSIKTYEQREFLFNFLYCSQIPEGQQVIFRLLPPDPQKCPDGYVSVSLNKVHTRRPVKDDDDGEPVSVLATDAYDDPDTAPFYIDNILKQIEDIFPAIPDPKKPGEFLPNPEFQKLPKELRGAINDLVGTTEVMFPTAWWMRREVTSSSIVNGKEKKNYEHINDPKTDKPMGAIWVVKADSLVGEQGRIWDLVDAYAYAPPASDPDGERVSYINDGQRGHNLVFKRNHYQYSVSAEPKASPLHPYIKETLLGSGKYPDIVKNFRDKHKQDDVAQRRLIANAWFAEDLQDLGVDLVNA